MTKQETKLTEKNAALIVIDMQEKLLPAMSEMHSLIRRVETLLRGCALLNVPIIFTQQYTKGLGHTIEPIRKAYAESTPGAKENVRFAVDDQLVPLERVEFSYIEKTSFSVMGEPDFVAALERTGRRGLIVCGIESHVCVLQSAEDLSERGYAVYVAADASSSRRGSDSDLAFSRMARNGVTVTTTEALLFGLLKDAKHPAFRQTSELVK
jgi:nicotinamidase-related amidase